MSKVFQSKFFKVMMLLVMSFVLLTPSFTMAADSLKTISKTLDNPIATTSVGGLIGKITTWLMGFVGAIAVLMLIWGGVTYMTSAGSEERIGQGKKIITSTIIGLIISILAYVIVNAVVTALGVK